VSSGDAVIFRPKCRLEQRQSGASRLLRCQDQALRFERHDDAALGVVAGADLHGVIPVAVHARDVGPDRAVVAFGVPVVPVRRVAPGRAGGAHLVTVISCTVVSPFVEVLQSRPLPGASLLRLRPPLHVTSDPPRFVEARGSLTKPIPRRA